MHQQAGTADGLAHPAQVDQLSGGGRSFSLRHQRAAEDQPEIRQLAQRAERAGVLGNAASFLLRLGELPLPAARARLEQLESLPVVPQEPADPLRIVSRGKGGQEPGVGIGRDQPIVESAIVQRNEHVDRLVPVDQGVAVIGKRLAAAACKRGNVLQPILVGHGPLSQKGTSFSVNGRRRETNPDSRLNFSVRVAVSSVHFGYHGSCAAYAAALVAGGRRSRSVVILVCAPAWCARYSAWFASKVSCGVPMVAAATGSGLASNTGGSVLLARVLSVR